MLRIPMFRFLSVLAISILHLCATQAFACSCADAGAPCRAFAGTPVVFTGTVIQIGDHRIAKQPDYRLVVFAVEHSYRGSTGKYTEVLTGFGGSDCGYAFRQGEQYVVYAVPWKGKRIPESARERVRCPRHRMIWNT
jgi:hypothetical protein